MKTKSKEKCAPAVRHAIATFPLIALLVVLFPAWVHAGTWIPFGPKDYVRGTGAPVTVTDTFTLLNPATQYTLKAFNGGLQDDQTELVAYSVVTLNGVQVVGPGNFSKSVSEVDVPITPQAFNTLSVQVRGQPGGVLTIEIVGVDNDPPVVSASISPLPNAAGWNNSNVTVSFTCSDKTSGVAFCPAPVAVTNEGASQIISGTAMDLAGNTATASVTVNLDKTPPNIFGTVNPPPDASGWNNSAVTVSFTCSDALSGVTFCSSPVAVTTEGANQIVMGTATDVAGNTASTSATVNISTKYFYIRNYAGKCLDYGTSPSGNGATVFLNDCASAHSVRVEEIDNRHEVILHAGTKVIGIHNPPIGVLQPGTSPTPAPTEFPVELQFYLPTQISVENQIFALDGDSIILANSRQCLSTDPTTCPTPPTPPPPQLAIQIQNARGVNGSPLVASLRNLADSEFWDFKAIDGSDKYPTSGFIQVETNQQLWNAICSSPRASYAVSPLLPPRISDPGQPDDGAFLTAPCSTFSVGWGSVVVISDDTNECAYANLGPCIDLTEYPPILLPAGVTLRGIGAGRRGTNFGPQLFAQYSVALQNMLEMTGDYVRITGMRLRGPTRDPNGTLPGDDGIQAWNYYFGEIIDHNDLSDWANSAVEVFGDFSKATKGGPTPHTNSDGSVTPAIMCPTADLTLNDHVHIYRNFVHHNDENIGDGYALVMSVGGTATVSGNTFLMNRHDIAGDGDARDQYAAWFNLVMSRVPVYDGNIEQLFDMHGAFDGYGGYAGNQVEVAWNTFLPNSPNKNGDFQVRGQSCGVDSFHDNVSLLQEGNAVYIGALDSSEVHSVEASTPPPSWMQIQNNRFADTGYSNPTTSFGVGDFDGDGVLDTFMATGAAFYYAPGGAREWRFLSAKTDGLSQVLLGDFDGDGRTDVVAMHGGQLVVSWGGASDWEVLNANPCPDSSVACAITDMAVGKFLAHPSEDLRDDIFYASGPTPNVSAGAWYLSYGGSEGFNPANTSSFHRSDLRFGDFDGDGMTDVFGVVSNGSFNTWSYSKSATGAWADGFLQKSLDDNIGNLVVADFDGNGRADVGESCGTGCWRISYGGSTQQWASTNFGSFDLVNGAAGHFGQNSCGTVPGADILVWNVNEFSVVPCGTGTPYLISSQDMR